MTAPATYWTGDRVRVTRDTITGTLGHTGTVIDVSPGQPALYDVRLDNGRTHDYLARELAKEKP